MKSQAEETRVNDQNDDSQSYALMVLAGVVALVLAGVIAIAVSTTLGGRANRPVAAVQGKVDAGEPEGRVDFEAGSASIDLTM